MSQTHLELFHLTSMLEGLDDLPDAGPSAADRTEARRTPSAIAAIFGLFNLADAQQVLTGACVRLHDHSRKSRHLVVPALWRPVRDVVPDGAEHLVGAA